MTFDYSQDAELRSKTLLLREIIELLMWEHTAISNQQWEAIPELKEKKASLASRMKEFDWLPRPEDSQQAELMMLKTQVTSLEYQSRQKIQVQMQIIKARLQALQQQQNRWLDCLHLYCRKSPNSS